MGISSIHARHPGAARPPAPDRRMVGVGTAQRAAPESRQQPGRPPGRGCTWGRSAASRGSTPASAGSPDGRRRDCAAGRAGKSPAARTATGPGNRWFYLQLPIELHPYGHPMIDFQPWRNFMTSSATENKAQRPTKTLQDEINSAREKLRRLEEREKEQIKKDREKNQRLIVELLKTEKLDIVSVEQWKKVVPKLRELLVKN